MISTHRLYSVSSILIVMVVMLAGLQLSARPAVAQPYPTSYVILPADAGSEDDVRWAGYLLGQSRNRVSDISIISVKDADNASRYKVYVHIDRTSGHDYSINEEEDGIILTASSDNNMLWLIYQWIAKVAGSDPRWDAADLDPPVIVSGDSQEKFDFGYRSIYSSGMNDPDKIAISGDMHVDYDWGIWGHNLRKVFPDMKIPSDAMAVIGGKKTGTQLCFSSETLKESICRYILDNYGTGEDGYTGYFAIIPEDNMEVCTCNKCIKAGNTPKSATPAVTALILELAERFPYHNFYTSAYNTTTDAPELRLPENAGVIISAIDLPMAAGPESYLHWEERVAKWKEATDKIIVWDYMRNFDDYLTPFPCLTSIQNRLKQFKSLGIYGVFYNGSGDDYSTFDDIQTYVISSLLKNTALDIRSLVAGYLEKHYPSSGKTIASYYLGMDNNPRLELYAGIDYALQNYIDAEAFNEFYKNLDKASKQAPDTERKKLNMLLTALNFTRLEIIRSGYLHPDAESRNDILELLKGHTNFSNMDNFKEKYGSLDEYIKSWNTIEFYRQPTIKLEAGDQFEKLTDGFYGFPNDYHLHWVIFNKGTNELYLNADAEGNHDVELSFLNAPAWKIGIPSKIEIYNGGTLEGRWTPDGLEAEEFSVIKARIPVRWKPGSKLRILVYKGMQAQVACDEITIK